MADSTKKSFLGRFAGGMKTAGKAALSAYLNPAGTGETAGRGAAGGVREIFRRSLGKSKPKSFDPPHKTAIPRRRSGFVKTDA